MNFQNQILKKWLSIQNEILRSIYDGKYITVRNDKFIIDECQVYKKVKDTCCFSIDVVDYGFLQAKVVKINFPRGDLIVYVREYGRLELPPYDLSKAF